MRKFLILDNQKKESKHAKGFPMKRKMLFLSLLIVPLTFSITGCEKKEKGHFGPSPGDGEYNDDPSEHFGPSPGDGVYGGSAGEHFGPSPTDG